MRPRAPHALAWLALLAALPMAGCSTGPSPTPRAPCPTSAPTPAQAATLLAGADQAVVTTNKGSFTIALYGDRAPIAAANFVALAQCGFYDGISFHRVLAGFVAQAGDPQTKSNHGDFAGLGSGGPGYAFSIEPAAPDLRYDRYAVVMANAAQPNTNGSQFFIDLADLNGQLTRDYTIFGVVSRGTDTVDAIGRVPVNDPRIGLPLDPVIIQLIVVGKGPSVSPAPSG